MGAVMLARAGEVGGFNVSAGEIVMPRAGAWHADLTVDAPMLVGKVEIRIAKAGTLVGTMDPTRSDVHAGTLRARVVGGANGFRLDAKPRHYTTPTIRVVLRDLLADAGEALAAGASADVLDVGLAHWTTVAVPVGQVIGLLMRRAPVGTVWRLGADGKFWCGKETWPGSGVDAVVTSVRPQEAALEIGLQDPFLLPGTTVAEHTTAGIVEHKVDLAELTITGGAVHTKVWVLK